MNIVLIGYRGTGKSTIATLVGQQLGWDVTSTDEEIVRRAKRTIPEIVEKFGWDHFRDLETAVCQSFIDKDHIVIDTGGGAILREKNANHLKSNGIVFWLTASVDTIIQRIGQDTQRPSLTGQKTFTEEVEDVLRERTPRYAAAADHVLPTDHDVPATLADIIVQRAGCSPQTS